MTAGVYKDELNRSNPLGMKGQVADAFGDLITKLHYGSSPSYSPSDFKRTLARFAPSFSGYQQHDSQEFITFLLDGLHEDLNRIKKKPYVESPDWNGGGDAELARLAKVCWDNYKKRNDSVIVDLFQGQYKSCVSLPLARSRTRDARRADAVSHLPGRSSAPSVARSRSRLTLSCT